jgi:hypothetical protein
MKILLDMRPALDGHAGIPQETRLLFSGLNALPGVQVHGLVQSGTRVLARGLPARRWGQPVSATTLTRDAQVNRLARVVVSLQQAPAALLPKRVSAVLELLRSGLSMTGRQLLGLSQELTHFEAAHFRDFVWRALFAKTLEPGDINAVVDAGYRVASTPWGAMHRFGLLAKAFTGKARYPRIDTRGFDLFVAETPYPARVSAGTQMIVRYHDAIPMLMPHTISDKAYHQASHYQALRANVRAGAHFSCVSEATRADLLAMFPEVASRSTTIHNMISRYYFPETTAPDRIPEILRTRRNPRVDGRADNVVLGPQGEAPGYLLMVSTIEPRKNHLNLLSAWERLRAQQDSSLRLVFVGMLGWEHKKIVRKFRPWMERGELILLEDVPADELRLLYRHARCTVCPSLYEGFDFSGIEAMRSGGVVAASDIAVHREIYADACEYFSPYSPEEMAQVIASLLQRPARVEGLRQRGAEVSAQYTPDAILPRWQTYLAGLSGGAST